MNQKIVVSFIGRDEPGLVSRIADVVKQKGGNWLESRMSQLAGQFAGVGVVEAAASDMAGIRAAIADLPDISTLIQDAEAETEVKNSRILTLNIVGPDRPGIVFDVTHALAEFVANIAEMDTHVSAAPMTGEITFSADASVEIPFEMEWKSIAEKLDQVAGDLGVDILLDEEPDQ